MEEWVFGRFGEAINPPKKRRNETNTLFLRTRNLWSQSGKNWLFFLTYSFSLFLTYFLRIPCSFFECFEKKQFLVRSSWEFTFFSLFSDKIELRNWIILELSPIGDFSFSGESCCIKWTAWTLHCFSDACRFRACKEKKQSFTYVRSGQIFWKWQNRTFTVSVQRIWRLRT